MKKLSVAVLGATGAVGREMIKILEQRNFPLTELRLLSSKKSAGSTVAFNNQSITVRELTPDSFKGVDIALGAVSGELSKQYARAVVDSGAVLIDNSSAFRMDKDVPLVVPEINAAAVKNHKGIIANPNCSTIITLMAVSPINKLSRIKSMVVSTYQAVSGAGAEGITELKAQTEAMLSGKPIRSSVFAHQIAYNLIPQIGGFDGNLYTDEEMKLQNEGAKILGIPDLRVSCTCVRIPVERSHSVSVRLVCEQAVSTEAARKAIADAEGVRLFDDPAQNHYPMPMLTSGGDLVYVGRIREDLTQDGGLCLFCCGDQIRKGAALNAVQIAEAVAGER